MEPSVSTGREAGDGRHFKEIGLGSFFGAPIYEWLVPRDHFLVKLTEVIDWDAFIEILLPAYKGLAEEGRPPYPPVVILKMLVIARLFGRRNWSSRGSAARRDRTARSECKRRSIWASKATLVWTPKRV